MSSRNDFYTNDEIDRIFTGRIPPEKIEKILNFKPKLSKKSKDYTASAFVFDISKFSEYEKDVGIEQSRKDLIFIFDSISLEANKRNGYIDKIIGDAAIIVFGAPFEMTPEEQARAFVELSVELRKKIQHINIRAGIGFDTGVLHFGNYETESRPMFTPQGTTIYHASLYEEFSSCHGFYPATSVNVQKLLSNEYRFACFHRLDRASRPEEPQNAMFLIGKEDELSGDDIAIWNKYNEAESMEKKGEYGNALSLMSEIIQARPSDPLIENMFNYISSLYVKNIEQVFQPLSTLKSFFKEMKEQLEFIFGESDAGFLEQKIDGLWKFKNDPHLEKNDLVFSPGGDVIIWLKGLSGSASLEDAPSSLKETGFHYITPLRKDNEVIAALLIRTEKRLNLNIFHGYGAAISEHWFNLHFKWIREKYQTKLDDSTKLEEVNRQLESKSVVLQKLLRENEELNRQLRERVASHAAKLERASSLKRYLPPSVVESIIDGGRDLSPITERKKLTILFSDIKGFTSATDGLEPEEMSSLLNEYLSSMSQIAFKAGATIDKFRGDGMMVFFGAPQSMDPREGAVKCIEMAVKMCLDVRRLKEKWFNEGYDWELGIRIGINSGYATVGEFGSADRMDYTAIGTEVNIAARLEEACPADSILISHSTWALVKERFDCRENDILSLKGIHKKIRTYTLEISS
ncbi:MAG: hypothetical protein JXR86_18615 [Spirochaetales bacterium]|nr:hypothetical protein [Spirochaetales bacterium]